MNPYAYLDQGEVEKLVAAQPEGTMFIMKPRSRETVSGPDIAVKLADGWRNYRSRSSKLPLEDGAIVRTILVYRGTYIWSFS